LFAIRVASPPKPGALEHIASVARKNDSRETRASRDACRSRASRTCTDEKPPFGSANVIEIRRLPSAGFVRLRGAARAAARAAPAAAAS
jgi:hypothetical protein